MPSLQIVQVDSIQPAATANDDSHVAGAEIPTAEKPSAAHAAPDTTTTTKASSDQNLDKESSPSIVLEVDLDSTAQDAASDSLSQKTAPSPESRSKKRQVTPTEDESATSSSQNRKSQQKKVNQLMLSAFFHKSSKKESPKSALYTKISKPSSPSPSNSTSHNKESPASTEKGCNPISSPAKSAPLKSSPTSETENMETKVTKSKDSPKNVSPKQTSPLRARPSKASANSSTSSLNDSKDANNTALEHESSARDVLALSPTIDLTSSPNPDQDVGAKTQPVPTEDDLSDERKDLLKRHSDTRKRYQQRAEELVRDARSGLDEEDFEMPLPQERTDLPTDEEFPDVVASNMALLIEGSKSPLSKLVTMVCGKLKECHKKEWSQESVSTKIKVMAERKSYLGNTTAFKKDIQTKYEDEHIDQMWRWEVGILEILPSSILTKVRRARSSRRKLMNHYSAIQKLILSLDDADHQVWNMQCKDLDPLLSKVGKDEEKVLKFEREAEKQRLVLQAKKKKEREQEAKRKEKEQLAEEKRKEKERKRVEAERKKIEKEKEKQETAEAREAKRKKAAEKERQEQEEKDKLKKQKATFKSFFANSTTKEDKSTAVVNQIESNGKSSIKEVEMATHDPILSFDSESFRSSLNSRNTKPHGPLFPSLSRSALQSRKRRTRSVPVSVYITVMPEEQNAFDAQPFAEEQTIFVPNKYRFLSFHEDCRPAYHGTWSKKSDIVTGRTPFNKDSTHLDYDYDSEAEWEEGDDEVGEDVEDEAKNQEEDEDEGDAKMYDYDDGFCVADDQYLDIDEDVDEETKFLYKKKLQHGDSSEVTANRICILAPQAGGIPPDETSMEIEGFESKEATEMLRGLTGKQISKDFLWLDAFPPEKLDEIDPAPDTTAQATTTNKDEYSVEEMRLLASFAHHCPLNSKEKLIEELRNTNVDIFSSRAKAIRKLDSIATKKKHPSGAGVYWEVSKDVLLELGLNEILSKKLESSEDKPIAKSPNSSKKSKKKKSTGNSSPANGKKKSAPSSSSKGKKRKSTGNSSPADDKKKSAPSSSSKGKKRKNVGISSPEDNEKQPSEKKEKCVQDGSPTSAGKSPSKSTLPKQVHASATVMMNFLQPRKKPKAGQ